MGRISFMELNISLSRAHPVLQIAENKNMSVSKLLNFKTGETTDLNIKYNSAAASVIPWAVFEESITPIQMYKIIHLYK